MVLPITTPLQFDCLIAGQLLKVTTLAQTCQIPHPRFSQPLKLAGLPRGALVERINLLLAH